MALAAAKVGARSVIFVGCSRIKPHRVHSA
jgi:hypothetical protein